MFGVCPARPLSVQAGSHLVAKVGSGFSSPDRPTDGKKTAGGALAEQPIGAKENSGAKFPLGDGDISGGDGGQTRGAALLRWQVVSTKRLRGSDYGKG